MNEELINDIKKLIGGDPSIDSVNYMRIKLSDLLDEASNMVKGHIGTHKTTEDLTIISTENNILATINSTLDELIEYQINKIK